MDLSFWADVSQIATGVLAFGTAGWYFGRMRYKRSKLEELLKAEKAGGYDKGRRTVLHLMAEVGLTEDELLKASFSSSKIKRSLVADIHGRASHILFEYDDKSN